MSSKGTLLAVAAAAALGLAGADAHAAVFQNGSFELGTFVNNTNGDTQDMLVGSTVMTGWTVIGGSDVAREGPLNPYGITASDGSYNLDLTGYTDGPSFGGVEQTFSTILGATYVLTFDVGNSGRYNSDSGASVTATVAGQTLTYNNASTNPDNYFLSYWQTATLQFTGVGENTVLDLVGTSGGAFIGLDNVTVTCTENCVAQTPGGVPEPASWALMLLGFGGLGAVLRGRRKAALGAA